MLAPGCSDDDDARPGVTEHDAVGLVENEMLGTCLDFGPGVGKDVTELPVIDCALAHTHEIYAIVEQPKDAVYPGFGVLEDEARIACLNAFEPYVGRSAFDSIFLYTWLVPSIDSWNDEDMQDRQIICLLGDREGERLIGSKHLVNV